MRKTSSREEFGEPRKLLQKRKPARENGSGAGPSAVSTLSHTCKEFTGLSSLVNPGVREKNPLSTALLGQTWLRSAQGLALLEGADARARRVLADGNSRRSNTNSPGRKGFVAGMQW